MNNYAQIQACMQRLACLYAECPTVGRIAVLPRMTTWHWAQWAHLQCAPLPHNKAGNLGLPYDHDCSAQGILTFVRALQVLQEPLTDDCLCKC